MVDLLSLDLTSVSDSDTTVKGQVRREKGKKGGGGGGSPKHLGSILEIGNNEKDDRGGEKKCEPFQKCEGAACFVDTTGD